MTSPRAATLIAAGLIAAAGAAWLAQQNASGPSREELDRRVAAAQPEWGSYMEDVKAQVGAGPVAQWAGRPTSAFYAAGAVRVVFALEGPWAQRRAAMPVLLRTPYGGVFRDSQAQCHSGTVGYVFRLDNAGVPDSLPWAEIKYPGGERRLVFDAQGVWRAAASGDLPETP